MMFYEGMKLKTRGFKEFNEELYIVGKLNKDFPSKLLIKDGEVIELLKESKTNDWRIRRASGKEQTIGVSLLTNCEIVGGLPEDLFNV